MAVYILAWQLQSQLVLNYDVSWLMHAARRLLAGGTYSQDFFETNPPLILYLYLPPVILSKVLAADPILIFHEYIFLLASLSLVLSSILLRKIFTQNSALLANAFLLMLALVYLVLPCYDFGQRDHLLVLLAMPYLFLVVCRLQGKTIRPFYAFSLGVLAGLGFAIKPHFLITPVLVELYYIFYKRNNWAWLRPEIVTILAILVIYALSIFIFQPDYLYIVVPYSLRLYYSAVSQPWSALLLNSVVLYCAVPLIFYFVQYKENPYKNLSTVLALALLGFLLSYFAQRMIHFYHLIPALSLALLLMLVLFSSFLAEVPKRGPEGSFAVFLGVLIFIFPVWLFSNLYWGSLEYKRETLSKLAAFMETQAKQESVYFFVTAGSYAFPTVDYTDSRIAPRFYFLWMAAGLANRELELAGTREADLLEQQRKDKNFLVNMVADDLYKYKPRFIFVDQSEDKYRVKDRNFDYLTYFSTNQKFRQEWKNYRYFTSLEQKGLYKLGIYKRTAS